jgi:hypothetical protein
MGSRQRMQRTTFEPSGMAFMSGFPPVAEMPRTFFTLRSSKDSRSKESSCEQRGFWRLPENVRARNPVARHAESHGGARFKFRRPGIQKQG